MTYKRIFRLFWFFTTRDPLIVIFRLVIIFRGPPKNCVLWFLLQSKDPLKAKKGDHEHGIVGSSQTRDPLIVIFRLVIIFRGPPESCVVVLVAVKGSFESKEETSK